MRVIAESAENGAGRSRAEPSGADIVVLATEAPRRLLRVVEQYPSTLARIDPENVGPWFAIRGQSRGGVSRLQLTGHLDRAAGPLIQVWLDQAERASRGVVVLDLRQVSSMDEAGFLICLRAWGHAKLRGLRLRLTNCRGDAQRLLEETETGDMFGTSVGLASEGAGTGWAPILIPQVSHDQ